MELSSKAKNIISQVSDKTTKLGDLRNIAKELNHYGLEIHRFVFDYKSFEFRPRSIKSEQLKLRSLKCRFIPG